MNEIGIGKALEKLIEVLQLEGHELFRVFTEVQPAIAMCNAAIVLSIFIGTILAVVLIHNIGKKRGWFHNWIDDDITITYIIIVFICLVISLILSAVIADVYLRINYPEYYAATELMRRIGYMI